MHDAFPTPLQQWIDARTQLSQAVQTYVSATIYLESTCTPLAIKSHPALMAAIEDNLETLGHEELASHRAQAALKKKRNSYMSPISVLPSELLACIFNITVTPVSLYDSSNGSSEIKLSQVCSRWRQIAMEVCPAWPQVALFMESLISEGHARRVAAVFYNAAGDEREVLIDRPPDMDCAVYLRTALDSISPYIKQLHAISLSIDDADQLQLFLDFWLERGAPGSLTEFNLSVGKASVVFPEENSHASNRLCQFLRHTEHLSLRSAGLNWSSVAFDGLTFMWLRDLPSFCCPTLMQLARILSICSGLQTLWLERITFPVSLDPSTPELVALEYLEDLTLEAVDFAKVLSIISPGHCELDLRLQGTTCDADTLVSLHSFAGRAKIDKLTMTLSETRSDEALTRLLHSPISQVPDFKCLSLAAVELRDSEITTLAQAGHPPPLASTTAISNFPETNRLELDHCTINATPATFHDAMAPLLWRKLSLVACHHLPTTCGEVDGVAQTTERITAGSEFGARLNELMPGRLEF